MSLGNRATIEEIDLEELSNIYIAITEYILDTTLDNKDSRKKITPSERKKFRKISPDNISDIDIMLILHLQEKYSICNISTNISNIITSNRSAISKAIAMVIKKREISQWMEVPSPLETYEGRELMGIYIKKLEKYIKCYNETPDGGNIILNDRRKKKNDNIIKLQDNQLEIVKKYIKYGNIGFAVVFEMLYKITQKELEMEMGVEKVKEKKIQKISQLFDIIFTSEHSEKKQIIELAETIRKLAFQINFDNKTVTKKETPQEKKVPKSHYYKNIYDQLIVSHIKEKSGFRDKNKNIITIESENYIDCCINFIPQVLGDSILFPNEIDEFRKYLSNRRHKLEKIKKNTISRQMIV